jgi:precorrin-8X/cobalt-precorrin-8 methylmutase
VFARTEVNDKGYPIVATASSITADSFALIRRRLQAEGLAFEPSMAAVVERIIHSTADFEFARITGASPGAIEAGAAALRAGCHVVTDVQMVRVGISAARLEALGGSLHCFVADALVRERALAAGTTRSAMGIRIAAERGLLEGGIVAVGNAPTALYEIIRLIGAGVRPALVVGVPVGFVGTAESKAALTAVDTTPWIVTEGCKGGSPVAVAVVNALLRLAAGAAPTDLD